MIEGRGDEEGERGGIRASLSDRERTNASKDKQKKAADGFNAADFGSSTWPAATKIY